MQIDKYDRKILAALAENARIRFAELARRVNLSAPAVADRVEKLERAGIITGYHVSVDSSKVGCPIQCVIELTVKHLEYYTVIEQVKAMPEIIECVSVTGTSALLMRAALDAMPSLQGLIARLMQYGDTKTSIVVDVPVPPRLPAFVGDDS
ncbi:MAG: Lrp/AsnC family transcriptional regulator [Burkholderiaceae bacterium]|nr:Lrp/AsnC family transcriptional regulator [Burkholderiaceae bacterium]